MRGRAHLVLVDTTGASTVQTIAEGSASSCLLSTTWAIVFRNLELEASTRTQVRTPTGAVTEFCFTPAGRAFYRVNRAGPFVEDDEIINANRIRGGMLYTVADLEQPELVVRRVFVPAAGVPRLAPGVIP